MISISRTLTLTEYRAANALALQNGTTRQRINFWLYLRLLPALSIPALFLLSWRAWNQSQQSAAGPAWIVFIIPVAFLLQPLLLRIKIKRLYKAQQLDRVWTIEITEQGVRSMLAGLADSHLEWVYFDKYIESEQFFVLLNSRRPAFISLPKRGLATESMTELQELARVHIVPQKV